MKSVKKKLAAGLAAALLIISLSFTSFAAPDALPTDQYLYNGMYSNEVADLQDALASLGYLNSIIDGIFGSITESAVINFQTAQGLYTDGIAGPITIAAINSCLGSSSAASIAASNTTSAVAATTSVSSSDSLAYGSTGNDVVRLQQKLANLGYLNSVIDGIFGYITESAVYNYQLANGLYADGIAGPITQAALGMTAGNSGTSPSTDSSTVTAVSKSYTNADSFTRSLSYGTSGDDVLALQQKLAELGYLNSDIDGIYGSMTEGAVSYFQFYNNLPNDGVAGPLTLSCLFSSSATPIVSSNSRKLIFVGDSRTNLMYKAITNREISSESSVYFDDEGNIWAVCPGRGFYWMTETGIPAIEKYIDSNTDIIILTGINNITTYYGDAYEYCYYINSKAAQWKALGANTYYVAVGPVGKSAGDNYCDNLANYGNISEWNNVMSLYLSGNVGYIDLFSFLINDYATTDGVHYDAATSIRMYNYIISGL